MITPPSIHGPKKGAKGAKGAQQPTEQRQKFKKCCSEQDPHDDGEGHIVCYSCFAQLAETNIVNEVGFSEDQRGATTAQGGFVTSGSRHANTLGAGARRLGGSDRDAGQNAAANAKRILSGLCPRLNLSDSIKDQAVNLYQLASASNFSTGRRTEEVVAACLYAVCRRHKENQVLLIDISELQRINVFRLGEVYKALCKDVYLETDGKSSTDKIVGEQYQIEVESLIMKYCRKLEFGDKTRQVAEDAARILRRMKRDWIVTGRHPAGLCGACIIYAARMNNFRRTKREVVYVAKVADQTVAKRMEEFKRTRSAAMTVDQFREKGLLVKQTHDPPALAYHEEAKAKFLEKKRKRSSESATAETAQNGDAPAETENLDPALRDDGGQNKRQRMSNGAPATPAPTQQEPRLDADGFAIPTLPASMTQQSQPDAPKKKRGRPKGSKPNTYVPTSDELFAEAELEQEIQEMLEKENEEDSLQVAQRQLDEDKARERDEEKERKEREREDPEKEKEAQQERAREKERHRDGRNVNNEEEVPEPEPEEIVTREDLEAEFADDLEVQNCLLPEMERKVKEQIWVAENEDWMRVQVVKEINARLDKETKAAKAGNRKGGKGKRKNKGRMGDGTTLAQATTPIETPLDASRAMFESRGMGLSKHLDYSRLTNVYGRRSESTSRSRETSEVPSSRATSVASSERERGETPAEGTPAPTQRTGQAAEPQAVSPSQTQAQAQGQGQAAGGAEEEDEEGDTYMQDDDELDYGSDEEGGGGRGWLTSGGDEDMGEDDYGPLSRNSLRPYDDDEYGGGGEFE